MPDRADGLFEGVGPEALVQRRRFVLIDKLVGCMAIVRRRARSLGGQGRGAGGGDIAIAIAA